MLLHIFPKSYRPSRLPTLRLNTGSSVLLHLPRASRLFFSRFNWENLFWVHTILVPRLWFHKTYRFSEIIVGSLIKIFFTYYINIHQLFFLFFTVYNFHQWSVISESKTDQFSHKYFSSLLCFIAWLFWLISVLRFRVAFISEARCRVRF